MNHVRLFLLESEMEKMKSPSKKMGIKWSFDGEPELIGCCTDSVGVLFHSVIQ